MYTNGTLIFTPFQRSAGPGEIIIHSGSQASNHGVVYQLEGNGSNVTITTIFADTAGNIVE